LKNLVDYLKSDTGISKSLRRTAHYTVSTSVSQKAFSKDDSPFNQSDSFHTRLERRPWIIKNKILFSEKFQAQCADSFVSAKALYGVASIIPIEAVNLPTSKHSLYIRVSYGRDVATSLHATGMLGIGSRVVFKPKNKLRNTNSSIEEDYVQRLPEITFVIDKINSLGIVRVSVMSDCLPVNEELCRVEIPILKIIEFSSKDPYYLAYFPLLFPGEYSLNDGDIGCCYEKVTSGETSNVDTSDSRPFIRLLLKYTETKSTFSDSGRRNSSYNQSLRTQNKSEKIKLWRRISLPAISVTMVNSSKKLEIASLSVSDFDICQSSTTSLNTITSYISTIQFDNHLKNSSSNVILSPSKSLIPKPFLIFHTIQDLDLSHDRLYAFNIIALVVQEIDLAIEQISFIEFADMLGDWFSASQDKVLRDDLISRDSIEDLGFATCTVDTSKNFNPLLSSVKNENSFSKYYIMAMEINPIKINLSLIVSDEYNENILVSKLGESLYLTTNYDLVVAINKFIWQVGEVVLELAQNVHDHQVKINPLKYDNLFLSRQKIGAIFSLHYLEAMIEQLHRATGAIDMDFIGNSVGLSVGLVSSLKVGVKDFFYEPGHALITSPGNVGSSVVKGAVSFVANTTDGMIGATTRFTRSCGKIMSGLSSDSKFIISRQKLQKPPNNSFSACKRPLKDIYNGLYYGVAGIITEPIQNIKQ